MASALPFALIASTQVHNIKARNFLAAMPPKAGIGLHNIFYGAGKGARGQPAHGHTLKQQRTGTKS